MAPPDPSPTYSKISHSFQLFLMLGGVITWEEKHWAHVSDVYSQIKFEHFPVPTKFVKY